MKQSPFSNNRKKDPSVTEAEIAQRKAKALEPAVYAECRGSVTVLGVKTKFARYFLDGLLVAGVGQDTRNIELYLTRNGDQVASFPLEHSLKTSGFVFLDVSHDGKHLTYADGNKICSRTIPLDRNGDIISEASRDPELSPEEEEEEVSLESEKLCSPPNLSNFFLFFFSASEIRFHWLGATAHRKRSNDPVL